MLLVERGKLGEIYSRRHQMIKELDVLDDIGVEKDELCLDGGHLLLQLADEAFFLGLLEHQHRTEEDFLSCTLLLCSIIHRRRDAVPG